MQDNYRKWDSFDVDKEMEKVEESKYHVHIMLIYHFVYCLDFKCIHLLYLTFLKSMYFTSEHNKEQKLKEKEKVKQQNQENVNSCITAVKENAEVCR
jgi:hypothetical protein